MLKFDFRKRVCICTTAWETHYENESFPDKTESLNIDRGLVSKNELPDANVITQSTKRLP